MVAPFLRQAWAVSGVLLNMLGQGLVLSYTSVLVSALQAADSDIPITIHTASWIASSVPLAGFGGFCVSALLMDTLGRKKTHFILIIPGLIGWILIHYATNITTIIIGRMLGGFTGSGTVCLGAVVIGEYSSPSNRGMFLNLKTAAVCVGNMIAHILGHLYHWRFIASIAVTPQVIAFAIILTWPESPAWLASKNEYELSRKSFEWLRGTSEESKREFENLIRSQKERIAEAPQKKSIKRSIQEVFNKFTRKDFVRPLLILMTSIMLLESCGRHVFPAYATQIISNVTGSQTNSFYYTLAIDIIITISAVSSSILVKLMKRRTLLLGTGFAAYVVLMSVCLYLFLAARGIISSERTWIPISVFVVYFILANLGCTAIPLALLGEIFPLPHKSVGSLAAGFSMATFLLLHLQVAPYLLASVNVYGMFAVFGTLMGITLIILYFILPETKDRTLQEIEDYFNYGKFKDNTIDDEANLKMLNK